MWRGNTFNNYYPSDTLKRKYETKTNNAMKDLITKEQAKEFTTGIFQQIENANTIEVLTGILNNKEFGKNKLNIEKYPRIEFNIQPDEVRMLLTNGKIDQKKISDPLTKLLYAMAWKQGDLNKIKHIINGILHTEDNTKSQENALVFYQFGKHLTKSNGEPIIDQHVLRAFSVYKSENERIKDRKRLNSSV